VDGTTREGWNEIAVSEGKGVSIQKTKPGKRREGEVTVEP